MLNYLGLGARSVLLGKFTNQPKILAIFLEVGIFAVFDIICAYSQKVLILNVLCHAFRILLSQLHLGLKQSCNVSKVFNNFKVAQDL